MTIKILDVKPLGVTVHEPKKKKLPETLVEIKAALMEDIRAAARKIDQEIGGRKKPSHTWLAVRTDSKRHVLKFVVKASDDYMDPARTLAAEVEKWVAERFNQDVPVEVTEPPTYEVELTGNRVCIYRGAVVPSRLDDGIPF